MNKQTKRILEHIRAVTL